MAQNERCPFMMGSLKQRPEKPEKTKRKRMNEQKQKRRGTKLKQKSKETRQRREKTKRRKQRSHRRRNIEAVRTRAEKADNKDMHALIVHKRGPLHNKKQPIERNLKKNNRNL